ncbi:MAG: hypothetical protein MUP76_04645 [Acidimicrobiia bacterium]|nr:hypothetical protein [Acidimicrobiia bacterium]
MIHPGDDVVFTIGDDHHQRMPVKVIRLVENDRADIRLPGGGSLTVPLSMLSQGTVRRVNGST